MQYSVEEIQGDLLFRVILGNRLQVLKGQYRRLKSNAGYREVYGGQDNETLLKIILTQRRRIELEL